MKSPVFQSLTIYILAALIFIPNYALAAKKQPKPPTFVEVLPEDVIFSIEVQLSKKKKKTVMCLDIDPGFTRDAEGKLLFYSYGKLKSLAKRNLKKAKKKADQKKIAKFQKKIKAYQKLKKLAGPGCRNPPFFDLDPFKGTFGKKEARHLCDRFFGCSSAEVEQMVAEGLPAALNRLLTYHPEYDLDGREAEFNCRGDLRTLVEARGDVWDPCDPLDSNDVFLDGIAYGLLDRFILTTNPIHHWLMWWLMDERQAVSFAPLDYDERWSAVRYIQMMKTAAFTGDFKAYSLNFTNDFAAGLKWMNLGGSDYQAANEDEAREIQELGTIGDKNVITGEQNYTNVDIAAAACAMSGWVFTQQQYFDSDGDERYRTVGAFAQEKGCPSPRILYAGTPYEAPVQRVDDVIDAIFARPELAENLAYELWRDLIGSNPSNSAIQKFAEKIRENEYNLLAAIGILVGSQAMFHPENYKTIISHPLETAIRFSRQTGFPFDRNRLFHELSDAGQAICYAPNVFGWYQTILLAANKIPDYFDIFLEQVANIGDYLTDPITDGGLAFNFQTITGNLQGDGDDATLLVNRLNEWMNLDLNDAQKGALVTFMNYRWETCDSYEVDDYGCIEGEKFAKRDAYDADPLADPRFNRRVQQVLYMLLISPYYAVK